MPKSRSAPASVRPRVRRGNADDALRMRQDLLDAAAALFAANGLDAVTMRAVAARVGVSPMAPYRYFNDKSDLLRGLWEQVLVMLLQHIEKRCPESLEPDARKAAEIESFLEFWETHPDEFALVYLTQRMSQQPRQDEVRPIPVYAELLARFERSTREYAAHNGIDPGRAAQANELVFVMQLGYLQAAMVNRRYPWSPLPELRRSVVEAALALMHRTLVNER